METSRVYLVSLVSKMKKSVQKKLILDTVLEKSIRLGIRRVTMDEIARDLRISKKTIYVHFPNKEALIRGCVERISADVIPEVEKALEMNASVTKRLMNVWQTLAIIHRTVSAELLADLKSEYPHIWDEINQKRLELLARFETVYKEGIQTGEIRSEIHPRVALRILWAILEKIMVPEVLTLGEFTYAQAFETIVTVLNKGMLKRPSNRSPKKAVGRRRQ